MNEIVSFTKKIEFKTLIYEITSISLEHTLMSYEDETIKGDLIVRGTYKQMVASQIDNPFNYKIPIDIVIDSKYDISDMTIDIDDFTYEVEKENVLKLNIDLILDKLKLKEIEKKEEDEDVLIQIDDLFKEEETKEKLEFDPPKEMRNKEEQEKQEEQVEVINIEPTREEKDEMKEQKEPLEEEKNEKVNEETRENNPKEPLEAKKEREEKEKNIERNEPTNEETSELATDDENKESNVSESLFAKLDTTSETYKTYSIYIVREDDSLDEIMKKYNVKKENLEEYNNLSEVKKGTKLIIPCNNE